MAAPQAPAPPPSPQAPAALTIAGSDSGGGAGIQADLKTFAAHGVFGTSAITALTAQNTHGVLAVEPVTPAMVAAQISAVAGDIQLRAIKTGMLATAAIVEAVTATLASLRVPLLVIDPVLRSTSGHALLDEAALPAFTRGLLPLAAVVTPNLPEAEMLAGLPIRTPADRREAAARILGLGVGAVVITGGHLTTDDLSDLLFDGRAYTEFRTPRVPGRGTHGTGCTFSAALTAQLALGRTLVEAVPLAQAYIAGAIARGIAVGTGPSGPMDHFWRWREGGAR